MSLNERKIQILQAIINDYIETAEPVGSRTIAKKYNLGISSATIRNEMSDLEEMGFILQPHASWSTRKDFASYTAVIAFCHDHRYDLCIDECRKKPCTELYRYHLC